MKLKDIKEVLKFLNKDRMDTVKKAGMYINNNCPDEIGLKKYDHKESCQETESCYECWFKSLELEENRDKLEDEIDIEV